MSLYVRDICVSDKCCNSILEDKARNIKALVVTLPSYFINTKVFSFPIFDLC